MLNQALIDYYRCPDEFAGFTLAGQLSAELGYFRFGQETTCYGRRSMSNGTKAAADPSYDALDNVSIEASAPRLTFDPAEVIDNLRRERYPVDGRASEKRLATPSAIRNAQHFSQGFDDHAVRRGVKAAIRKAYYLGRPLMSVGVRRRFQKLYLGGWDEVAFPAWPVDRTVDCLVEKLLVLSLKAQGVSRVPFIWFWPEGHPSCAIMTHDVEQSAGLDFCQRLMDIDDAAGIKASFQIVPEKRYRWSPALLKGIRDRGFEVNVQDLNHDGNLYQEREEFVRRARKINHYVREFGASGFRSGALYRNLDWYDAFEFSYDMSVPNVAHLDPQRGGCCTVMPYFIGKILEIPVTATQDYTLFHILEDYAITLWVRQIEMIRLKGGLASFIVHPDYVIEERAQDVYRALLAHLSKLRSEGKIWIALPCEVDRWWRQRSRMKLINRGGKWDIEGEGRERARIAYATLDGEHLNYSTTAPASASMP